VPKVLKIRLPLTRPCASRRRWRDDTPIALAGLRHYRPGHLRPRAAEALGVVTIEP
jgi:hypothetical protein